MGKKSRAKTETTDSNTEIKRDKKAAVLNDKKKSNSSVITGAIVAVVVAAVIGIVAFSGSSSAFEVVKAESGIVKIPVTKVSDGKAHYFTYKSGAKDVNFFVLKSSDGVIRAAFDACDVCFREKRGYRQEGDYMVCNNCGQRFASVKVNEIKGGCNPAPVNRQVKGEHLELDANELASGVYYF